MSLHGALRGRVSGWAAWAVGFVFMSLGPMPMYAAPWPVPAQVRVGSVPYDRVLARQLTLTSVTLNATDGSTTTIICEPTDVEFTRLANNSEPLFVGELFPLRYTGVTITVSGGKGTYLRSGKLVEKLSTRRFTTTIRFRPAYALPYSASVLITNAVGEDVSNDVIATMVETGASRFQIDQHGVDMTGLENLQFDRASFVTGQAVRVQSASHFQAGNDGTFDFTPADLIQLEPQSLTGTVANYQQGSAPGSAVFDLRLPNDGSSALQTLNPGLVSLHVYQQPGTELHDIAGGLKNGMKVQARGLLFFSSLPESGSNKVFIMVVKQVSQ